MRRLPRLLLPPTVAILLLAGGVGVANASDGQATRCPKGYLCLYEDANFKGRMVKFADNEWQRLRVPWDFNDKTSSWKNRSGRTACLSWDWRPGRERLSLPPGSSAHMGSWNDQASGVKVGSCWR
jgi:hypothetical protein